MDHEDDQSIRDQNDDFMARLGRSPFNEHCCVISEPKLYGYLLATNLSTLENLETTHFGRPFRQINRPIAEGL